MNIQIITSSYPAYPNDPSGTAGLFVQSFALELQQQGHRVIIQPVSRKKHYQSDDGLVIEPLPWKGGDKELASLNLLLPWNWITIILFFFQAKNNTIKTHKKYCIDRTLCMWALPSGLLGYWMKKTLNQPYDVWALGSDIWKIQKIPFLGKFILKKILNNANNVFADGIKLCQSVKNISKGSCIFLPSSRVLPKPESNPCHKDNSMLHLLFVGRYHINKGPDILLQSFLELKKPTRNRVRIHMYGLGPLKNSLEQFIITHKLEKHIDLNDAIEATELTIKLQESHYLIIPSRIESIPVIFSDALQIGTPIISTPVGDLKSLIQEHQCGLITDAVSAKSLANTIKLAINLQDQKKHAHQASKLAQQFNLTTIAKKWLNF